MSLAHQADVLPSVLGRAAKLAVFAVPILSGCDSSVTIDCADASANADGLQDCGGVLVRQDALTCSPIHETPSEPGTECSEGSTCQHSSECTEGPHGTCLQDEGANFYDPFYCGCDYGCAADADCPEGNVCDCFEGGGHCVVADCKTSADCNGGECQRINILTQCAEDTPKFGYRCTLPEEVCNGVDGCGSDEYCAWLPWNAAGQDQTCQPTIWCSGD